MTLSIKYRLTLTSLVANFAILGGLCVVAANWFVADQYRNVDTFLQTEAQGLTDTLGTFLTTRGAARGGPMLLQDLDNQMQSWEFMNILNMLIAARQDQPRAYKITFGVFNRTGAMLMASNTALPLNILQPGKNITSTKGPWEFETVHIQVDRADLPYRLMTLPIMSRGTRIGYVRIACLLTPVDASVAQFQTFLFLGLPFLLLLNGAASLFVLSRAFKPVSRIIGTIHRITERNLALRVPIAGGGDEIRQLSVTFNDMLDRIEGAFMYQVRLVQDLSHQLRTPLAVMHGSLENCLRRPRSRGEYQEVIGSNLEELEYVASLIDGMLLLAQLDSRSVKLQLAPLRLGAVMAELVDELSPLWEQKDLNPRLEGDPELAVAGDKLRLRQMFINVLDNAFKYSPRGGTIGVSWAAVGAGRDAAAQVSVKIVNQGPPIPSDLLDQVFERFYRVEYEVPRYGVEKRSFTRPSGFGLGLSISRSIAEAHYGTVRAFNTPEGGAGFEFLLPAAAD